jgi:TPR repeat protein
MAKAADTMNRFVLFIFLLAFAYPAVAASSNDDFNAPVTVSKTDEPADNAMKAIYDAVSEREQQRAITAALTLANSGDMQAAFRLGRYFHMESNTPDYDRALKLYRKAADSGHAWATNNIGVMYQDGQGVEQSHENAREYFKKAAEGRNYYGYHNLAIQHFKGNGVTRDQQEGFSWLKKCMAEGIPGCYRDMYQIFHFGWYGVRPNIMDALHYLELAVKEGDPQSEWQLAKEYIDHNCKAGTMLMTLLGRPRNCIDDGTAKGIEILEDMARRGYPAAFNSLGALYRHGDGVGADMKKAINYWEKAASKGHCRAMMNLSAAFDEGNGVAMDEKIATGYITRAVDCDPHDEFNTWKLATRYSKGRGIAQDCARAEALFQKAASLGSQNAVTDIGYLYEKGCGDIAPDQKKAFGIYLRGAKMGVPMSQNNVGAMLKHGWGVPEKNLYKGYAWLKLAAENGDKTAVKNLLEFDQLFKPEDKEMGIQHYLKIRKELLWEPGRDPEMLDSPEY